MHKVLIDANTFKDIKDIYIVITHTHIKDLNKSKLVLMHFNTINLYEQAIKDGFKTAFVVGGKLN